MTAAPQPFVHHRHCRIGHGVRAPSRRRAGPAFLMLLLLTGCTSYESHYEKGVYKLEPIYCYQTIGTVDCHRQPDARDADRLVNYYGPAPSKYDPPDPPHLNKLRAPPKGQGYWRAPEPIPGPPPQTDEDDEDSDTNPASPSDTPPEPHSQPDEATSGPRLLSPLPPSPPAAAAPSPATPPAPAPSPTPPPAPRDAPASELPKAT